MLAHEDERLHAGAALAVIARVDRRVRGKARWHAWVWLIAGASTAGAYVSQAAFAGDLGDVIAVAYVALALLLACYACRQRVVGRDAARIERRMACAYLALCALTVVLESTVVPAWWSPWVIPVGLLPAMPCAVIAWKVLRG